jgi:tetratricopeptide (TPR) repeat protein
MSSQQNFDIPSLEAAHEDALRRVELRRVGLTSNDLGVAYYRAGKYKDARAAFQNAQEIFIKLGDVAGRARALGNLARVEEKSGQAVAALALYQQAADLLHEVNAREDEFATLKMQSQLYLKRGGWLQALAAFDRALTIKPRRGLFDAFLHVIYQIPLRMMGMGA